MRLPAADVSDDALDDAARALRDARRVVALTGAGISADSGLPTFRGAKNGLWQRFAPEDLATPEAFAREPDLVWAWYQWRRALVARARPNAGHVALVEIERRAPAFTLVTQNVDGLHRAAGSRNVITLHGELMTDRCSGCGNETPCDVDPSFADAPVERLDPARCVDCAAPLRPAVVWFGERLPAGALEAAAEAASAAELLLVVGTSGVVYPAAALAPLAQRSGARVIVINTDPAAPPGMLELRGPASELLPRLVSLAW